MDKIEDLRDIWDNGAVSPASLSVDEIEKFKNQTGATKVIGRKWKFQEQEHEIAYYVCILKDKDGLVHYENDDLRTGRLVVLNGDGTQRVVIGVPHVDANSRPEDGYLALPPSSARFGGIEWGCEGNDGYTDYLFDFDWDTGALLRYARPTRPW
ncbi:hypothetical protein [Imbroritus primus]|uniref:hypothetical protein n=1 Tax=Imbroritus primus TaxID=3058603 RepID=UPI003D16221D